MAETLQEFLAQLNTEGIQDNQPLQQLPEGIGELPMRLNPQTLNQGDPGVNPETTLRMLIAQREQAQQQRIDPRLGEFANLAGKFKENRINDQLRGFEPQVRQLMAQKFEVGLKKEALALEQEQYKTEQEQATAGSLQDQLRKKREFDALDRVMQAHFKKESPNPMDAQLAGVVQNPDGSYLTHGQVIASRNPTINMEDLILNNIALGNYLNQPYSPVNADEVQKRLDQEQKDQISLDTAIRKGTKGQTPEQRFLTLSKMSNAVANQMHSIATGLGNFTLSKNDADFAMKAVVIPMIQNIANYQKSFGVTPTVDPKGVAEAYISGDTTQLGVQLNNLGKGLQQSEAEAKKPLTSPDKLKEKEKPITTAQPGIEQGANKAAQPKGNFKVGKIYKTKSGARVKYKGGDINNPKNFEAVK